MSDFNILEEPFQLYDSLFEEFRHETLFHDLDKLIPLLRTLDLVGMQIVSLLIHKHSKNTNLDNVPFQGTTVNSQEVCFDIRNFDPILQHILFEFAKRHLRNQNQTPSS